MRSVALAVVLAQCGCFVPAARCDMTLFDAVLCRVGSNDYLSAGISTFMAEMLDCSSLLGAATERSLVIVDELGRGTSTFDGFGLAWKIAEEIVLAKRALMLFATHFHEMTQLESATGGRVANVHVSADTNGDDLLRFLYQVRAGSCDRSFGVAIAKLAGLPDAVVAVARAKATDLEFASRATGSGNASAAFLDGSSSAAALTPNVRAGLLDIARRATQATAPADVHVLTDAARMVAA